jgi:hypothetical protein
VGLSLSLSLSLYYYLFLRGKLWIPPRASFALGVLGVLTWGNGGSARKRLIFMALVAFQI